jgi:hypothetical protein
MANQQEIGKHGLERLVRDCYLPEGDEHAASDLFLLILIFLFSFFLFFHRVFHYLAACTVAVTNSGTA